MFFPALATLALTTAAATPADLTAGDQAATLQPAPLDAVVHQIVDGTHWAMGHDWKASFGPEGARFIPFLGSDAPRNFPVDMRLASATIGGQPLELSGQGHVSRSGNVIDIDRGSVIVRYHLDLDSIEQTFVLPDVPRDPQGDLEVHLDTDSELALQTDGAGMRFAGERGGVLYGAATAIDGAGRTRALDSERAQDRITIRVPRSFVADAVTPLVVDPVLSTYVVWGNGADVDAGDLAFEPESGLTLHAHNRYWSQSDKDVYSVFVNQNDNVTGWAWVDISDQDTSEIRVAANAGSESFLIVAQRGPSFGSDIVAWTRSSDGTLGQQLTLANTHLISYTTPRVGGDANPGVHGTFLVAWEGTVQGGQFLQSRIVHPDGSMDPVNEIEGELGTGMNLSQLEMSRTNGKGFPAERRWNLVWTRGGSGMDNDIRGAQIGIHGQLVTDPFFVDSTPANHHWPVVAAPLDAPSGGPRDFLAVYAAMAEGTLHARLFKGDEFKSSYDLSQLEAEALGDEDYLERDRSTPTLATDETQIVVGYRELVGNQVDIYLSSWRLLGSQLIPTEPRVALETSPHHSNSFRMVAEHESGAFGSRRVRGVFGAENNQGVLGLIGMTYETPAGFDSLGTVGCAGMPNSTGHSATFRAYGSDDPTDNRLWLDVDNLPTFQTGVFLMAQSGQALPMGQGFLCLGAPIVRLNDTTGNAWFQGMRGVRLDLTNLPPAAAITQGQTWHFQYWYRDLQASSFNFSNSLVIPFQ